MNYIEKSKKLQQLMIENNIDTFILTKFDPHQSEDGGDFYNLPKYFSGFTGSNAKLVITQDKFYIFTDARYYAQCIKETNDNEYTLIKESELDSVPFFNFAIAKTKENGTISIISDTLSVNSVNEIAPLLSEKNIGLVPNGDLINQIWTDRSLQNTQKIFELDIKYAGETRASKISSVQNTFKNRGAKAYILSSLDDIAYILNLRGFDIPYNTFFYSFMVFEENKTTLFVDLEKITEVKSTLEKDNVLVRDYNEIFDYIRTINNGTKTLININKTCYKIFENGEHLDFLIDNFDITSNMKSIKNSVELTNIKASSNRDNAAIVRSIKRVKDNANNLTEYDVNNILLEERKKDDLFIVESFHPICAYNANAAMAHYHATKDDFQSLKASGSLLIDSGASYYDGTTDITRTIALGEVSDDFKTDFTLVLKSHIKVATAKFLSGATGSKIDAIAREPMWNVGRNYNHGTGHGIAYVGPVHEGPQNLGYKDNGVALKLNMIMSNEPGLYVDGKHGIRTENTVCVVPFIETIDGAFFQFETLSYCPIDTDLIKTDMLTQEEKLWLNNYHKDVYKNLSPYLAGEDLEFLQNQTKEI